MSWRKFISVDVNKRFGKPCVTGTRITVDEVLSWMSEGRSFADIQLDFPEITEQQLRACLAYAADRERMTRSTP